MGLDIDDGSKLNDLYNPDYLFHYLSEEKNDRKASENPVLLAVTQHMLTQVILVSEELKSGSEVNYICSGIFGKRFGDANWNENTIEDLRSKIQEIREYCINLSNNLEDRYCKAVLGTLEIARILKNNTPSKDQNFLSWVGSYANLDEEIKSAIASAPKTGKIQNFLNQFQQSIFLDW